MNNNFSFVLTHLLEGALKSIRYIVWKDLREWRQNNQEIRKYSFRWWESYFISQEKHPYRGLVLILIGGLIITLTTIWIDQTNFINNFRAFIYPRVIDIVENSKSYNDEVVLSYFTSLWGVQSAIVALIYPIVIAFVTILLQKEISSSVIVDIYLRISTARSSGMQGLALVTLMGIQYLMIPLGGHSAVIAWSMFDGMVFLCNMLGTTFFIHQTFRFLNYKSLLNVKKQWLVNIAQYEETDRALCKNIFESAYELGFLSANNYADNSHADEPGVRTFSLEPEEEKSEVTIHLNSPGELVDVRCKLLAYVANRWVKRAKTMTGMKGDKDESSRAKPLLIFPLAVGSTYSDDVILCSSQNAPSLNWWERVILRHSMVFAKSTPMLEEPSATISELLSQTAEELQRAIRERDRYTTDKILHDFLDMFTTLIKSADFNLDNGNWDNYTNLSSTHGFRTFSYDWLRLLDGSTREAAELCMDDDFYVKAMAVVPALITQDSDLNRHHDVITDSFIVWIRLSLMVARRWESIICEQIDVKPDSNSPIVLPSPFQRNYHSSVQSLLGRWENLRLCLLPAGRKRLEWEDLVLPGKKLLPYHLYCLAYSFLTFVNNGDKNGTEIMADGLSEWPTMYEKNSIVYRRYSSLKNVETIGLKIFDDPIKTVLEKFGNKPEIEPSVEAQPFDIFSVSTNNYWKDFCLVICAILIRWSGNDNKNPPSAYLPELSKKVLTGCSLNSSDDLLMSMFRIRYSHGEHEGFDGFVEKVFDLNRPGMIPGRVYTLSDASTHAIEEEMIILFLYVSFSSKRLVPAMDSRCLDEILADQVTSGTWAFVDVEHRLRRWNDMLEPANFVRLRQRVELITGISNADKIEELRLSAYKRLQGIHKKISGAMNKQIMEAEINQELITNIGKLASGTAFSGESGLPLSLFLDINFTNQNLNEWSLAIQGMNREEFTTQSSGPARNRETWYAKTMKDHVGRKILSKILSGLSFDDRLALTPDLYWQAIKEYAGVAKELDKIPILFVQSRTNPEWLGNWLFQRDNIVSEPRPDDMRIWQKEDQMPKQYLYNLNNVEVYYAPIASDLSYLLMKESMQQITFHTFGTGQLVDASFIADENKPLTGTLHLNWQFKITIEKLPAFTLHHSRK